MWESSGLYTLVPKYWYIILKLLFHTVGNSYTIDFRLSLLAFRPHVASIHWRLHRSTKTYIKLQVHVCHNVRTAQTWAQIAKLPRQRKVAYTVQSYSLSNSGKLHQSLKTASNYFRVLSNKGYFRKYLIGQGILVIYFLSRFQTEEKRFVWLKFTECLPF